MDNVGNLVDIGTLNTKTIIRDTIIGENLVEWWIYRLFLVCFDGRITRKRKQIHLGPWWNNQGTLQNNGTLTTKTNMWSTIIG